MEEQQLQSKQKMCLLFHKSPQSTFNKIIQQQSSSDERLERVLKNMCIIEKEILSLHKDMVVYRYRRSPLSAAADVNGPGFET